MDVFEVFLQMVAEQGEYGIFIDSENQEHDFFIKNADLLKHFCKKNNIDCKKTEKGFQLFWMISR